MDKKKLLWAFIIGAFLGEVLTLWLAPSSIVWYFKPPVEPPFSCSEPIYWALHRLRTALIVGMVGGGVVGLASWIFLRRRFSKKTPHSIDSH